MTSTYTLLMTHKPRRAVVAAALALACMASTAQAQPYPCGPDQMINSLANAVMQIAPRLVQPRYVQQQYEPQYGPSRYAQPRYEQPRPPVGTLPPPREQWKRNLLEEAQRFCRVYPDDEECQGRQ